MEQHQPGSPFFYRTVAVAFFVISGVLFWFAATRRAWFFWAMAAISLVNGMMTTLKALAARQPKDHG